MSKTMGTFADELSALGTVLGALEPLDEEKRAFVLKTTVERLGVRGIELRERDAKTKQQCLDGSDGSDAETDAEVDVPSKEFMRRKQAATDVQRIACLAYYMTHARSVAHFKTADLTRLNTEAAGAKFSNAAVAVQNATNLSGFLDARHHPRASYCAAGRCSGLGHGQLRVGGKRLRMHGSLDRLFRSEVP